MGVWGYGLYQNDDAEDMKEIFGSIINVGVEKNSTSTLFFGIKNCN